MAEELKVLSTQTAVLKRLMSENKDDWKRNINIYDHIANIKLFVK